MMTETYQGWTNRETWCAALWINNEQHLQEAARAVCNTDGEMLHEAAKSLEDWFEGEVAVSEGMMQDLLNCALARINYREIAATFRD